jgi:hypothetical protein
MRKPYRVRALLALALVVPALAAACGDDGADVRDVGDTTTGSTTGSGTGTGTGSGTGSGTGTTSPTGTTTSGETTETEPTTTG